MNIPGLFQEIGDDFLVKAKELFDMHTRLYEQTDGTVSPLLPNERILGLLDNLDRKLKDPHRTVTTLPPQVFSAYASHKIVIYMGLCSYASALMPLTSRNSGNKNETRTFVTDHISEVFAVVSFQHPDSSCFSPQRSNRTYK